MIFAELERRGGGSFAVRAAGHAGYGSRGGDIVCAAVTILLRTAAETLETSEGIMVTPLEVAEGLLAFTAECAGGADARTAERLTTAGDFLAAGLGSLAREFPGCVKFTERGEAGF
ncbi:MAG: hypothetical protein Pg6C_01220 [Treponemataceae bacterium]|nr:MAG: hypothetical protein Pg6C_01220 [Treponemataceae bacterium]